MQCILKPLCEWIEFLDAARSFSILWVYPLILVLNQRVDYGKMFFGGVDISDEENIRL